MKRVALLQYHKSFDVCANRRQLLEAFNPGVPVFGLFGGPVEECEAATGVFRSSAAVYCLPFRSARWAWQNTDLAVREWYIAVGHGIPFDMLHVVQWDLLLLASLDRLYAAVPLEAIAVSGLTSVSSIADRWHWTRYEPHTTELRQLGDFARNRYGAAPPDLACLGPGYALSRAFLARYAAADVPELAHDELRLPLFARIFNLPVVDTGFYRRWFDPDEERFFNANDEEIDEAVISRELADPDGRRVFHPFRRVLTGWQSVPSQI